MSFFKIKYWIEIVTVQDLLRNVLRMITIERPNILDLNRMEIQFNILKEKMPFFFL